MEPLAAQIMQLELKLLHTDMRANPTAIDELLDGGFEEIGSDGQAHSRQQAVAWLLNKDSTEQWSLMDFRIKPLSNDMVIAVYRAVRHDPVQTSGKDYNEQKEYRGSIRSSVWQRCGDHWKMVFHQATQRV
ncbi:MAG: DUF4440 domain-containing protein [Nitrosomonas sp.]|nr:DUF4440 domain-containing protein [Nitrosomonas sp.]MCW5608267.1 DUF4440 domain-containing protein [Nitrosomonas sp.]